MFYLRKNDENEDRAVYKHPRHNRYYRNQFEGIENKHQGMKVYTCKTLKRILELRIDLYNYCGEWFDVYNEHGIVHGEWEGEI
ncbi:MAG: hypothetical protein IJD49_04135 [Clostridia bacterium]|nr:hypothetical protein [Clostridia bacterium]